MRPINLSTLKITSYSPLAAVESEQRLSHTARALIDLEQEPAAEQVLKTHAIGTCEDSGHIRTDALTPLRLPKAGTVFTMRHGRTYANRGLLGGISDDLVNQLDDTGRRQAEKGGRTLRDALDGAGLKLDAIVVSPLGRAQETARIVAEQVGFDGPVVTAPILREHHCGIAENRAVRDLSHRERTILEQLSQAPIQELEDPEAVAQLNRMMQGDVRVRIKGGESLVDVIHRERMALQWLEDTFPGQNVLVISHAIVGGAMRILLEIYPPEAADPATGLNFFSAVPDHATPVKIWPPSGEGAAPRP